MSNWKKKKVIIEETEGRGVSVATVTSSFVDKTLTNVSSDKSFKTKEEALEYVREFMN